MANQKSSRRTGIRYLAAAAGILSLGLWLTATKPVWLAPPFLEYTPLLYVGLAYAWLALLYLAAVHLAVKKGVALLLIAVLACGQWFCWASVAPRQQILEITGGTSAFAQRQCQYTSPEIYVCRLRSGSSDSPAVWVLTQKFRVGNSPFMWLIESDFRVE